MLVKTRLSVTACLSGLAILLAAGILSADTTPAESEEPDAQQPKEASDEAEPADLSLHQQQIQDKYQNLEKMLIRQPLRF